MEFWILAAIAVSALIQIIAVILLNKKIETAYRKLSGVPWDG